MRYVFTHVRSRLDADTRRRRLAEEREGAARLVSGALSELGQAILAEGVNSPELTGLLEAVGRAQAQRETAQAEIGSTEIFRASEEARLGTLEATLGAELDACERGVEEAERALRQIDDARRKLSPAASPGAPGEARPGGAGSAGGPSANPPADTRRLRLDQQYDGTRERAAALRAAGLAARAKLDQATAARRQAMAALNASITGHARERTEAEHRIEELQNQIGRVGWQLRIPHPRLMARYQRIDRHQQTITDRDRQIATVAKLAGRYDRRKLGLGIGLLAGIVVVATLLLGVLVR
jgi:chromosome segregation ATPase